MQTLQTSPIQDRRSVRRAVQFAVLSAGFFSLMFALIKLLGKSYPAGEILFCRSFFALIPLLPVIIRSGGLRVLETKKPYQHLTRSLMGLCSAFFCIESLKLLPLGEATTIFYSAPLITTIMATPLLGEKISRTKVMAVISGFLGVLYMMQPQLSSNLTGAIMALASALGSGLVSIELRRMGATEKSITIVVYFMLACSLAGLATMPFQMVVPNWHDGAILLGIGVVGGIAQIAMTEAYHQAPASTVAPISYTSLIWALIFDFCLFAKAPNRGALIGALVIALSGIFVVRPQKKAAAP